MNCFDQLLRLAPDGRLVSWLPMAHIAERNCTQYLPMTHGLTTTCCPDPRQVVAYLVEVRPTWFFAVPRIWEKLKAAMEIAFEAESDVARKEAIVWALEVGMKKVRAEQAVGVVPPELALEYAKADEEVLSDLRARIGLDQVESVNVGAAPTPRQVIEFFHAIGIELAELWGMSETSGAGTTNRPGEVRIGTVGPAAPGIELKLADDGEVLLRGAVVMPGYRNDPEKTAETIDEEGWIHTGDVGELDDDGFLTIIDRKKEIIINSAGKNMSPANIEAKLKTASPLIGQVCAVGDDRPYNVALIVLDPDAAPVFAAQEGIEDTSLDSLANEPAILEEVAAAVERGNARPRPGRADQAIQAAAGRVAARRRRADADDEAETAPDRTQVRGRDRGDVRRIAAGGPPSQIVFRRDAVQPDPPADAPGPSGRRRGRLPQADGAGRADPAARGRALDLPPGRAGARSARSKRCCARRWRRSAARRC